MSIASAITAAQGRVSDCYTAISNKGGTLPATQNLANMPTAIGSIPGGSSTKFGMSIDNFIGDLSGGVLQEASSISGLTFTGVEDLGQYALYYKFRNPRTVQGSISFPSLTSITGKYACAYAFQENGLITSVNLSNLKTISGGDACGYMFAGSNITSFDLSSLETINGTGCCEYMFNASMITSANLSKLNSVSGTSACMSMFNGCQSLTSVDLSELTTISGNTAMGNFVYSCSLLNSFALPKLTSISGSSACNSMVGNTKISSLSFPLLSSIKDQNIFFNMCRNCPNISSISFSALTTGSFGSYVNQFQSLFNSSSASTSGTCTVHFPSNLQSKVSSMTGYPTFGGNASRIVIAFDLPATS